MISYHYKDDVNDNNDDHNNDNNDDLKVFEGAARLPL